MYGKNFVIRCNLQYAICLFYKLFYSSYPKSMFFSLFNTQNVSINATFYHTIIIIFNVNQYHILVRFNIKINVWMLGWIRDYKSFSCFNGIIPYISKYG